MRKEGKSSEKSLLDDTNTSIRSVASSRWLWSKSDSKPKKSKQIEFPIHKTLILEERKVIEGKRLVTNEVDGKKVNSQEPIKVDIIKTKYWEFKTTKKLDDTSENRKLIGLINRNSFYDGCKEFNYMNEEQFEEIYEIPAEFFPYTTQKERRNAEQGIVKEGWKAKLSEYTIHSMVVD